MVKLLRWGLIGCGDIARRRIVPAIQRSAEAQLVAVARADSTRAAEFADVHGIPRWFSSWRELIASNDIDAVYIATPPNVHAEQTIAAASHAKHVLCEKPMALTVADCDQMIAACESHGVSLSVAFYRALFPAVARMREILASGEIGQPLIAHAHVFSYFDPSSDPARTWFAQKDVAGGGPLLDLGCHRVQLLLTLFGPIRTTRSLLGSLRFKHDVEDTGTALLEFSSGVHAVLATSRAVWERRDTIEVFGTRGSLVMSDLSNGVLRIDASGQIREERFSTDENGHVALIADFSSAIRERRPPHVTGRAARDVVAVTESFYAQSGM